MLKKIFDSRGIFKVQKNIIRFKFTNMDFIDLRPSHNLIKKILLIK